MRFCSASSPCSPAAAAGAAATTRRAARHAAAGTGGGDLSGRIQADGSSTVGPYTTAAAEKFQSEQPNVQVTVGVSGTGGGFERFCRGETDLSNASRPIKDEEATICKDAGIDYVEFQVANDALTVVVNKDNDWVDCLTTDQLKKIWEPELEGEELEGRRPVVSGRGRSSSSARARTRARSTTSPARSTARRARAAPTTPRARTTTRPSPASAGEKGGLGYFGFSYFEENQDTLKALEIDGGDGCVAPSVATAQDGTYKPLSRPLFIYVKKDALARPEVEAFLRFVLDNETSIAETSQFVPLTEEQLTKAKSDLDAATGA